MTSSAWIIYLQELNSTILEAQLMSHDSSTDAIELFTHFHMLRRRQVLNAPSVALIQGHKDRLLFMTIGSNDLFGPNANQVQEWKKDPETEQALCIATAVREKAKSERTPTKNNSSAASHPARSLQPISPLEALPALKSKESYRNQVPTMPWKDIPSLHYQKSSYNNNKGKSGKTSTWSAGTTRKGDNNNNTKTGHVQQQQQFRQPPLQQRHTSDTPRFTRDNQNQYKNKKGKGGQNRQP